jgi:hypothetical protein
MGAGDSVFVGQTLHNLGLPGAIIIVLMFVVGVLGGVIALMYRHANKVYGYRLAERDTLNTALRDSKEALASMRTAMEERNRITDELADVIEKQSVAFESVHERIKTHYEFIKDDHNRLQMVVSSMSEALRNISAETTAIKLSLPVLVSEVGKITSDAFAAVLRELNGGRTR